MKKNTNTQLANNRPADEVDLQKQHEPTTVRNIYLRPGQDYVDGQGMYYIVRSQGTPYVIGPDNTMLPADESRDEHIIVISDEVPELGVSPEFLNCIAEGSETINPSDVFTELVAHLRRYIIFKDQRMYILVATWIMASYHFRIFSYFPYLHVFGEKNSGKSILLEVLLGLVFNGTKTDDATPIAIASRVSEYGATILYDEAETLGSQKPTLLSAVLKSGFSHAGRVSRKNGTYMTYSPKVLASINGLENVLSDRTLPVRMVRKLPGESATRFIQSVSTSSEQQQLREKLYLIGMQHGLSVAELYYTGLSSLSDRMDQLQNRNKDLWIPLFSVAAMIGKDEVVDSLFALAGEISEQKVMQDHDANATGVLTTAMAASLSILRPARRRGTINYYRPDEIIEQLVMRGAISETSSRTAVTRLLNERLSITTKAEKIGKHTSRLYAIPDGLIDEYIQRYTKSVS